MDNGNGGDNIKEEHICFNTGMLAKEKGFNIPCEYYYVNRDLPYCKHGKTQSMTLFNHNKYDDFVYSLPTQALLQKWLREIHKIVITIIPHFNGVPPHDVKYHYRIFVHTDKRYYNTYEEALEIALQEALNQIKTK